MYRMYQKYIPPIGRRYRYIHNTSKHACDACKQAEQIYWEKLLSNYCIRVWSGFFNTHNSAFRKINIQHQPKASSTTTTTSGRATFGSESVIQQQPPPPHTTETCYIRLCQCFHSFGLRVRSLFWLGLAPFQPLEVH